MTTVLPAGLAPWAEALSLLDADLAAALGPLLRGLDGLMSRHADDPGAGGDPDGYGGISTRGTPERILASEWLLADELPLEFLRRVASGELLHLEPARRAPRRRGGVAVVLDCGPDQLGACRLVQLAALVVAYRRAQARGGELAVGLLGDEVGTWRTGGLGPILSGWLRGRRATVADPTQAAEWTAVLDPEDELWVFCGPRLSRALPGRRGVLVASESTWDDAGVTSVRVACADASVELAVPQHAIALRALRGGVFRSVTASVARSEGIRQARFMGAEARLLALGRDDAELLSVSVRDNSPSPKLKRYQLPGPAIAASCLGKRMIAAVIVDDELRIHTIGKRLGLVRDIAVSLSDFDTPPVPGLSPMHYDGRELLLPVAGKWYRICEDGLQSADDIAAVGTAPFNNLRVVREIEGRLVYRTWVSDSLDTRILFGPDDTMAWSDAPGLWHLTMDGREQGPVSTEDDAIGVVCLEDKPVLITLSGSGLIVRAVSAAGVRTHTKWSGGFAPPTLHPTRPWIVVQRTETTVQVGDLATGHILLTLSDRP